MPSHDRLDRLSQHFPALVQILGHAFGIRFELVEARSQRLIREQTVRYGDAQISHDRRVAQIPLPARDGQFLREVLQQSICNPEIAFGILKIDRVDLMRHGR